MKKIWIFNGANGRFPSAVFESREDAEVWIKKYSLTGVLTKYSIGISVYEWAIANNHFKAKSERDCSATFIQGFSSAAQEHMHYENGSSE